MPKEMTEDYDENYRVFSMSKNAILELFEEDAYDIEQIKEKVADMTDKDMVMFAKALAYDIFDFLPASVRDIMRDSRYKCLPPTINT